MATAHCTSLKMGYGEQTARESHWRASQVWSNPQCLSVPMLFVELEKVSKRTNFRVVLYTLQDMAEFVQTRLIQSIGI